MTNKKVCKLELDSYSNQRDRWPKCGKHILAQYDTHSIVVYQAYNPRIAEAIVSSQNFHSDACVKSGFSMNRMTWIKTNFLWMMFRSGWASKPNQERILAIRLCLDGFEELLTHSVCSKHNKLSETGEEQSPTKNDSVRLQWDPDHLPNGDKAESRRAIQLGIRGEMLERLSKEFIVGVEDITDDVVIPARMYLNKPDELMIPHENVYIPRNQQLADRIELSSS